MNQTIEDRLAGVTLKHGSHKDREDGMCAMEFAAFLANEPHSAHPACVSPVIRKFMIRWNDRILNEARRTAIILPLVPLTLNTIATPEIESARMWRLTDWGVRTLERGRNPEDAQVPGGPGDGSGAGDGW